MKTVVAAIAVAAAVPAFAQSAWDLGKKVAGKGATATLEKQINKKLLEESRKNQCSFKTDSDQHRRYEIQVRL